MGKWAKECHRCHGPAERSERFDTYFCGRCGLWLEGACGDPKCSFCTDRPPEPPAVVEAATGLVKRRGIVTMEHLRDAVRRASANGYGLRISTDGPVCIDGERVSTSAKDPK
jgi:hypothetical protein